MAKRHWLQDIRGHPEYGWHAHGDAYTVFCARSAGLTEAVMNTPIAVFHQYHGSTWLDAQHRSADAGAVRELPRPSWVQVKQDAKRMLDERKRPITTEVDGPNPWHSWGLGSVSLPETTL